MKLELVLQKLGLIQPGKIMYIGGSDVLPAPLRPEDERRAIEALAAGDETARQTLIEHNLRLVVYIARRFENTGVNLEDLISIGTIGLIKAVNTFRPDRNIKLATYSSRCIENEILMHIRKIANQKTEVSLDEPINTDWDGNELLLSDVLGGRHSAGCRSGRNRSSPCASASAAAGRRRRRRSQTSWASRSRISRAWKSASCCGCGGRSRARSAVKAPWLGGCKNRARVV